MKLLSCGYSTGSDKIRAAVDASWWSAPYSGPLWNPLMTWAMLLEKSGVEQSWNWYDSIAEGDVSSAVETAKHDLAIIADAGRAKCAPYIVPAKLGALPLPNPTCLPDAALKPGDTVVDIVRTATTIPWWLWLVIGAAVAAKLRSRR